MEDFEEIPESSGYRPLSPELRGRHASFASAVDAAFGDLTTEKNEFFDSLADRWKTLFPDLPARPGRYEDGKIFLYVPNAAVNFMALKMKVEFEDGADIDSVMQDVIKNCKIVEDDCQIFL